MTRRNGAPLDGGQLDELTFEPVRVPEGHPAIGLIPESLPRRQPEMIIR